MSERQFPHSGIFCPICRELIDDPEEWDRKKRCCVVCAEELEDDEKEEDDGESDIERDRR